jgi:hypothetical protein
MLIPEQDYQEPYKDYYQSFARRDLYSELISVSMSNRQKHWYFKVFYYFFMHRKANALIKCIGQPLK